MALLKILSLFACLALFSFVLAEPVKEFTAKILIKEANMQDGGVVGNIVYSYSTGMYQIFLPSQQYNELFDYNDAKGMDPSVPFPYKDQYVFKNGDLCECQTGVLDHPMPMLFPDPAFWNAGILEDIPAFGEPTLANGQPNPNYYPGDQCTRYTLKSSTHFGKTTNLNVIAAKDDGTLCWARFKDGREMFFLDFVNKFQLGASAFTVDNSQCKCSKPLDICLVVDRSASVNRAEWNDFRTFLLNFKNQFDISTSLTQISVVSFKTEAKVDLELSVGTSTNNVGNAINNMLCEVPAPDQLCAFNDERSWTSVTEGIRFCAQQLDSSSRNGATPVMVVLTDGYHNVKYHSNLGPYNRARDFCYEECSHIPLEGSPEWIACATPYFSRCRNDLQATMEYAKNLVPGLVSYGVGIGDIVSDVELLMIAQGDQSKVLLAQDFATLASSSLEIVSRACDANDSPCGDSCCGFCVCKQCQAPDFCDDGVFCTRDFVKEGGICCTTEVRPCENSDATDKCVEYICYEEACQPRPKACPATNDCFTYACTPATGVCAPTLRQKSGTDICHVGWCDQSSGKPVYKIRDVAAECRGSNPNPCLNYGCDSKDGSCVTTPKPQPTDKNVCNEYTCDSTKTSGDPWVKTTRQCPEDTDACTTATCHSTRGCETVPVVCAEAGNKCDLSTCNPADTDGNPCNIKFVECAPFLNGDKCRPLKKQGGSIDSRGCNKKTGECEYDEVPCPRDGCFTQTCNSQTGTCDRQPTAGCGVGFCQGEETECVSDLCVERRCDSTKSSLNCDIETKAIDCARPDKQPDKCLEVDTSVKSANDVRSTNPGCDHEDLDGDGDVCAYRPVNCDAFWSSKPPLTDKCRERVMDSTADGCCVERPIDCSTGNPCVIGSCDPANGECIEEPACPPSDACVSRSCVADGAGHKCIEEPVACASPDPCLQLAECDPTGSGCVFVPYPCDDEDPCTTDKCVVGTDGAPACESTPIDCDDANACTVDACEAGVCTYVENSCDDGDLCTTDRCDVDLGCLNEAINVTKVCNDDSLCTIDTCEADKGCVNTAVVCEDSDPCTMDQCDPFSGCVHPAIQCDTDEACRIGFCNPALLNGTDVDIPPLNPGPDGTYPPHPLCDTRNLDCFEGESIVITAGALAAGAIVGIIVGIVACLACTGGGVFAAYKRAGLTGQDSVMNNPLYKGDGNSGTNPLFKADT